MPTKTSLVHWSTDNVTVTFERFPNEPGLPLTLDVAGGVNGDVINTITRGENAPGWKELLRRGEACTTSLSGTQTSGHFGKGHVQVRFHRLMPDGVTTQNATTHWRGPLGANGTYFFGTSGLSKIDPVLVNTVASERLNSKALAAQRALQSLVSAGELGETLRMIRRPLQSLFEGCYDYLESVKKRTRRARSKRKKRQIISDTWLEYSFGWQPLVGDIRSAADAMARLSTHRPPYKVVSAGHNDQAVRSDEYTTIDLYNTRLTRKTTITESYSVRMKASISVGITPTFTTDVLGLSLRDLVPTIWELIPYSFLVDYFVNTGSLIDYYSLRQADFRWGWKTWEQLTAVHMTLDHKEGYGSGEWIYDGISGDCGDSVVNTRLIGREGLSGFPYPSLRFKIPGTSTKWLNIGALLGASDRTSRIVNRY